MDKQRGMLATHTSNDIMSDGSVPRLYAASSAEAHGVSAAPALLCTMAESPAATPAATRRTAAAQLCLALRALQPVALRLQLARRVV